MDIRLNKLISDSGICSRREADKYIEEGHVTVNGKQPHIGQRVNENDIVIFDDLQIKINKRTLEQSSTKKTDLEIEFDVPTQKVKKEKTQSTSKEKEDISKPKSKKGLRPGKYVKYTKYAAARHAAREAKKKESEPQLKGIDKTTLKEALQPKFGKSLSRSAVAQRLAASPKSAALRKTSRNNPANKAKRFKSQSK
ncbi:MAG: pseudouridine synthase [Parabacteroides sp.]|nr:pseudouridine synthase [Parabacteroides sp.]